VIGGDDRLMDPFSIFLCILATFSGAQISGYSSKVTEQSPMTLSQGGKVNTTNNSSSSSNNKIKIKIDRNSQS